MSIDWGRVKWFDCVPIDDFTERHIKRNNNKLRTAFVNYMNALVFKLDIRVLGDEYPLFVMEEAVKMHDSQCPYHEYGDEGKVAAVAYIGVADDVAYSGKPKQYISDDFQLQLDAYHKLTYVV